MKKILSCLITCLIAISAVAQGTAMKFTLEDCLGYALGNNYKRQSLKLSEESKQNTYEQSKMERLPNLNASAGESFSNNKSGSSWSGDYGLSTSVTLFRGGAIGNTIEQSKLASDQSGYITSQYENTLTIQILEAFLSVLGNEELLKFQNNVVEASSQQVKQGSAQLAQGAILKSDYLLLEAQYVNDKNNISDTRIARDNSLLRLKGLLSLNPMTDLQVIPDTSAILSMSQLPALEIVVERTMITLPDLKISQYSVDIAGASVKLAKSGYYPSLSLSGGIGTGYIGNGTVYQKQLSNRFNQHAGLSLSIPIYNNGSTRSKVVQSRISLQQSELDLKQAEIDAVQNVATEYNDVVSAWNKYQTTDILQNAYLKTFEAYRVQFEEGSITPVDLLQQQNNYIGALNDFIQSKYGFMLKRKILDVYMGIPITM